MVEIDAHCHLDAYLKSELGEVIAVGCVYVNAPEKHITFTGNFVPLYPIGTKLEIVRLFEGIEVHKFVGKVYLSDKRLMRLVSVEDELLPMSDVCYCDTMMFPANAETTFVHTIRKKWKFGASKSEDIHHTFDIQIVELTVDRLVFQICKQFLVANKEANTINLEEVIAVMSGHRFLIKPKESFPIKSLAVTVTMPLYFGKNARFICDIERLSVDEQEQLTTFLWEYNVAHNKAF